MDLQKPLGVRSAKASPSQTHSDVPGLLIRKKARTCPLSSPSPRLALRQPGMGITCTPRTRSKTQQLMPGKQSVVHEVLQCLSLEGHRVLGSRLGCHSRWRWRLAPLHTRQEQGRKRSLQHFLCVSKLSLP
jgi:hypothetical protein